MIMKEIKIFLDKNKKTEVEDSIDFGQVVAGEKSTTQIYIQSTINYHMDVELELIGNYISISKSIKNIKPMETEEVEFEIIPKITIMKPITANLKIKINYIIT